MVCLKFSNATGTSPRPAHCLRTYSNVNTHDLAWLQMVAMQERLICFASHALSLHASQLSRQHTGPFVVDSDTGVYV